jgi:hypothetical protein
MCFADMLGISEVEAKQRLIGADGEKWEIDARGVKVDEGGFFVVECRQRSTARLKKDDIAALAFKVNMVGAQGAVIVTSIGLQKGAEKVAKYQDFKMVFLPKEGTFEEFFARCGDRLFQKLTERVGASFSLISAA